MSTAAVTKTTDVSERIDEMRTRRADGARRRALALHGFGTPRVLAAVEVPG